MKNWVKTKLDSRFQSKFNFYGFWQENSDFWSICHLKSAINSERSYLQPRNFANMCHICTSWNPRSFKCEKMSVSLESRIDQKSGKLGEFWNFSPWRSKFENFWNLTLSTYLCGCCVLIQYTHYLTNWFAEYLSK